MSILIENARIIDPASGFDAIAPLCIQGAEVLALGEIPSGFEPRTRVDASGCWVFPGIIDAMARLREPGEEHKATIASETLAAAHAGVTTLVVPPDTQPPIDSPAEVEFITRKAKRACGVQVHVVGAATHGLDGEQLAEIAALKAAGVRAVGQGHRPIASALVLRRAMEYAASFDLPVVLSVQDPVLSGRGAVHEGPVATRLGLAGIPQAAETAALGLVLALVEQTGARVIVGPVSTRRSVAMLRRARLDGLPISACVTAHHLHLCDTDVAEFDPNLHVIPPLRTQQDRAALIEGLQDGIIDCVVSDHQPHEPDSKLGPFAETAPGISAVETLLPLMMRLVDDGQLDLQRVLHALGPGPADLFGLPGGRLAPGHRADFVIYDPQGITSIQRDGWRSRGHNTPFLGWEFNGSVRATWISGREIVARTGAAETAAAPD